MNQTRTKTAVRGAKVKAKSGRRQPVRVKRGSDLPVLPIVVGAILLVLFIGIVVIIIRSSQSNGQAVAAGIPCDQGEHTQVHYHAAVQIMYRGNITPLPANIGIAATSTSTTCFYWLHVHAANKDVIHIESPASRTFTLGDFFTVWSTWSGTSQPLDATHVSSFTLTPDQKLVIYVDTGDGKGAQIYTGDPKKIVLRAHEVITLEIAPPAVTPPPPFVFTTGL